MPRGGTKKQKKRNADKGSHGTEPIIQTHNFEFATAQRTDSAPGVETKPNQRRTQNQPTRYYDQAPAMNWDHAASWGRGVWVSVSDIGRVGSG